jgi:hypothetical protein
MSSLQTKSSYNSGCYQHPKYEVADIFQRFGAAYTATHSLSLQQWKVMSAISACRTEALGGHIDVCHDCGVEKPSYNSCRNRHCPKCQGLERVRWINARKAELLPIEYFHWVFTLPHSLYGLVNQGNEKEIYALLFRVVNATLQDFALKKWDAEIGITMILHTWGQKLNQHIHIHCIVTGGALKKDGQRFIRSPKNYLFNIKAVQKKYRGKFIAELLSLYDKGRLRFSPHVVDSAYDMGELLGELRRYEWVVYAKKSFSNPAAVVEYLGRYTHKVALSNHRIESICGKKGVTFRYKDYRAEGKVKRLTLSVFDFLSSFLQHVLPLRFVRIRHYGLFATGHRKTKLNVARALLGMPSVSVPLRENCAEYLLSQFGKDIYRCPACQSGQLFFERNIEPIRRQIRC